MLFVSEMQCPMGGFHPQFSNIGTDEFPGFMLPLAGGTRLLPIESAIAVRPATFGGRCPLRPMRDGMIGKHRPSEIAELVAIMTEQSIFHTHEVTDTFRRVSPASWRCPRPSIPTRRRASRRSSGASPTSNPDGPRTNRPLLTTGACRCRPGGSVPPRPGASRPSPDSCRRVCSRQSRAHPS